MCRPRNPPSKSARAHTYRPKGGAPAVAGFGERQVVSRWFIVALSGEGTKKVIANEVVANEEGAGPRQCAAHQFVPLLDPELLQGS